MNAMAFGPGQRILLTGTSGASDGTDTLWNVGSPARPRRLAVFEGGAPTTLSPDGRTVATISFSDQPVLWNVSSLRKPSRIAQLRTGDHSLLWGEAFSPDGHVLASAFTDRRYLWDVADPARPRHLRTLATPVAPPGPATCGQPCHAPNPFYQGDIAFSPDGHLLAAAAGRNRVAVWNVTDPARATRIATFAGSSGFIEAVAFAPRSDLLADVSTPRHGDLVQPLRHRPPGPRRDHEDAARRAARDRFLRRRRLPRRNLRARIRPGRADPDRHRELRHPGPVRAASTPAAGPGRRIHVERDQPAIGHPRRHPQPPGSHPGRRRQWRPAPARPRRADRRGRSALRQLRDHPVEAAMTRTSHAQAGASRA